MFSPSVRSAFDKTRREFAVLRGAQKLMEKEVDNAPLAEMDHISFSSGSLVQQEGALASSPASQVRASCLSPGSPCTAGGGAGASSAPTFPLAAGSGVSYSERGSPSSTGGGAGSSPMLDALDSPRTPGGGVGSSGAAVSQPRTPVFSPVRPSFPTFGSVDKVAARHNIVAFDGVLDGEAVGARSSARIRVQHNADDTQMARAAALLEQRNFVQGTPKQLFSILPYSD